MTEPVPRHARTKPTFERILETRLFQAPWLMAPFYVGLVFALLALLVVFANEAIHEFSGVFTKTPEQAILMALSLIDLSLAGNLLLIVIFSGYENFVSKIDTGEDADRPSWMGTVDFSGLKLKLVASIVAISAISLLRSFMQIGEGVFDPVRLQWMLIIHVTFVVSGVLLAVMDWVSSKTSKH